MRYTAPDGKFLRQAFDSISPNYDRLNQILSFGQADRWRKKACEILLQSPHPSPLPQGEGRVRGAGAILDLGCGTGKFLKCCLNAKKWDRAVGLDFSSGMLRKARETVAGNVVWLEQDFERLPFLEGSFDLVISAFTLRSVQDMSGFLKEAHRVLSPGGRAAFLELTRPRNAMARLLFYPYLNWFLPFIGWLISGNIAAYKFLSRSVANFETPEHIREAMRQAGFRDFFTKSFSFGAATLIIGAK